MMKATVGYVTSAHGISSMAVAFGVAMLFLVSLKKLDLKKLERSLRKRPNSYWISSYRDSDSFKMVAIPLASVHPETQSVVLMT